MEKVNGYYHEPSSSSVVIEDDGKVCYAYLLVNDEIVSDVWLYNVEAAPIEPEWTDESKMPFANSIEYIKDEKLQINHSNDFKVEWDYENDQLNKVTIAILGKLHGILKPDEKPGWCRLSKKENPLAKPLDDF